LAALSPALYRNVVLEWHLAVRISDCPTTARVEGARCFLGGWSINAG
jgi:hypothetical protein